LTTGDLTFLGISGSLRKGSLNTALLRAAVELAPPGVTIEVYDGLRDIPPYDGDLDTDQPPEPVRDLRQRIHATDALLISTPEYNYSIPGVLKNAIDWASRPIAASALRHKPVATMGAAPGNFGTLRAQLALRQVWLWTESIPVMKPEVHVFRALERFDERGVLIDATTRALITQLLDALRNTVIRAQSQLGHAAAT
jgi:chromate reductase